MNKGMPSQPPHRARRVVLSSLQWIISLAALTYALWDVDMTTLWHAMRGYPHGGMLFLLLPLSLDFSAMALRLKLLLPGTSPFRLSLKAVLLCQGYNNILPAKAGEAIKIVYLSRSTALGISTITPCILWERLMDVLMLTGFGLLAMVLARVPASSIITLGLLGVLGGFFWLARQFSPLFHAQYSKLPYARVSEALHNLHYHAVDAVTLAWVGRGLGLSVVVWGLHCGTYVAGFALVSGFNLTLAQIITVYVITSLGTALPSSPGGLGVFEGAMVLALSWYGVDHSAALGFALFMHALYFVPVSLVAILLNKKT